MPTGGGEAVTPKPRAGQARGRRGWRRPSGRARARAARRAAAGRAARNAEAETRPKGAAGLRRHRRPPEQPPTLNRRLSSPPVKPAIAGGSQGGSGGRRGCAGVVEAERGIRARARGVRGKLPCRRGARHERSRAWERTARQGMCGRKGPGARTRGRRRHPGKLGGTPPRSPRGARAAEETSVSAQAPRLPRGSRWGRRTEPDRGKGGQGGNSPLPQEGLPDGSLRPEGQAGPTAARGEPSRPSPPAIRGRGRRRLAGGPSRLRPLSCGRGAAGWKGPVRRIRRSLPAPNSRAGWGGDPREGLHTCKGPAASG